MAGTCSVCGAGMFSKTDLANSMFSICFFIGIWNYRYRARCPPHMNTKISYADNVHPDELDEEFDTFPTSQVLALVARLF